MEAWVRFMATVTPQTATALMRAIDQRLGEGMSHLHLLISSPGGSVFHGLSLHNFLKGVGIEVSTYNFGSVDSIGVVIFCAGGKRYCVPNSRFHIHGVKLSFKGEVTWDEKALEEYLKLLKTDYTNVARVIAATTGKQERAIVNDMIKQTSLMPEQALNYGLVHEVRAQLIPAHAGLTVIYEDGSAAAYAPPPVQPDLVAAEPVTGGPGTTTGPMAESFTSTPQGFTGTAMGRT
jgi:ATP-dependent Clp protease protease subunit